MIMRKGSSRMTITDVQYVDGGVLVQYSLPPRPGKGGPGTIHPEPRDLWISGEAVERLAKALADGRAQKDGGL